MTSHAINKDKEKEIVLDYFKAKSKSYDLADTQCYWRLSDMILLDLFKKKVLDKLQEKYGKVHFFDAGGGTGRWSIQILKHYKNALGTIVDFSESMLAEAEKKLALMQLDKKVEIHNADLDTLPTETFNGFNLAFSFHNVIGFVKDPQGLINKMTNAVIPGGYVVVLAPNLYHSVFFNINAGQIDFAEDAIKTKKGKFTKGMPSIHMFTPRKLQDHFESAGLEKIFISGFPSAIYPQMQETQLKGSTKSLTDLLQGEAHFNRILEIEKTLLDFPDIAARGNQLIIIGEKPEKISVS